MGDNREGETSVFRQILVQLLDGPTLFLLQLQEKRFEEPN